MIKGKKFFITGGAGFIGTSLIKRLIADNEIVVYDNLSRNSLKDSESWGHPNLKVIKGDVLDYNFLKKSIPKEVDVVLHMAAIAGIDTVIKNPVVTMEVNIIGLYHLLKALRELQLIERVERFVNFSTSEVFGINAFRVDEKAPMNLQPVGEARWTYSVSKLAGEHLTYSYYKQFGLRAVTIRPFNVYGPGQVGEGAVHHFVVRAIRNEPLIIHGEGDQIRSWCYIDDMVDGILLCLEKEEAIGEVFNIGNPRGTITVLGLAEKVIQLARSYSQIVHVPKTYSDVDLRIPSIEKAKNLLGFEPKVDLNEGLKRTIEWYKSRIGVT
ncbi:MAG: GDP-mannose 4,6-dehydratase [Thermoproteota archaeon]